MMNQNTKFKPTEIGEIPENWSFTPFREVAYLSKEVFDPKKAKQDESSVYLGLEHFCEGGFALNGVGQSDEIQSSKFRFVSGDVLFGKLRPYFKKVYSPKFDGVCSTDIWVLRAKQGVYQKFLYFLVGSDTFLNKAVESSEGTKMPRASWDFIANYRLPIPPLDEQQQIASILSSLDDKIELNKQMNKTLEEIGKTLFKRWFVDFEFPNDEGKPLSAEVLTKEGYKSSGGKMVDSELGEIPKRWNIQPLGNFIEFIKGKKPKITSEKQEVGYLKQILIETLDTGKFLYAESQSIVTCVENDVLMVMDGASSGRVEYGYLGIIGSTLSKILVKEPLTPEFLYFFLKTKERDIRENTTGTSIPHADKKKIENYIVPSPSADVTKEFSMNASQLVSKILYRQIYLSFSHSQEYWNVIKGLNLCLRLNI